jgi:hypothetical protein
MDACMEKSRARLRCITSHRVANGNLRGIEPVSIRSELEPLGVREWVRRLVVLA